MPMVTVEAFERIAEDDQFYEITETRVESLPSQTVTSDEAWQGNCRLWLQVKPDARVKQATGWRIETCERFPYARTPRFHDVY